MDSIIFDVDGTLWDSTEIVAQAWSTYLRETEHMKIEITAARLMGLFGQLLPDIAKALFPDKEEKEQLRLIENCCQAEHEALLKTCAPLYPELESTLQILSEDYPLFIVSNCQAGYIEVFLKTSGLGRYFRGHLCPGDTGLDKAGNLSLIVEKYQLSSPIYVGDTLGDQNACKKAGVPFVHAAYGFGQAEHPDGSIANLSELPKLCHSWEE